MEARSTSGFSNQQAFIPVTTAQTRLDNARVAGAGYRVSSIQAKVNSTDTAEIAAATDAIKAYLMQAHGITNAPAADFNIFSSATTQESLTSTLNTLTLFLSAIAGISLLVGGIGVMNIMLVSVTERTREIGLRKAVGAQASTILSQFLLESILLSLLGGGVGILHRRSRPAHRRTARHPVDDCPHAQLRHSGDGYQQSDRYPVGHVSRRSVPPLCAPFDALRFE